MMHRSICSRSWVVRHNRVERGPALVERHFPVVPGRRGISGHSMGGHGALTLALRHPGRYQSVSAFAPICAPSQVGWGRKAFAAYLGDDEVAWQTHDAVALLAAATERLPLLVDQGEADEFLATQLRPDLLHAHSPVLNAFPAIQALAVLGRPEADGNAGEQSHAEPQHLSDPGCRRRRSGSSAPVRACPGRASRGKGR